VLCHVVFVDDCGRCGIDCIEQPESYLTRMNQVR
jgi:hypothetical protein